jgi:glutathione synthase
MTRSVMALRWFGPPALVTADRRTIRAAVADWGRAVLKPTDGMAGRGVLILDPGDPNLASILDTATVRGQAQVGDQPHRDP